MKVYKVETYDLSRGDKGLEKKLNEKLSEGWELIAVASHNIFIFVKTATKEQP